MTTQQFIKHEKTVTRRFGWDFLKPGDIVRGVRKGMGLKKGEKVEVIGMIRILSTRKEPLGNIDTDDCIREGFPDMTPEDFVTMLKEKYNCSESSLINRIEFEYI